MIWPKYWHTYQPTTHTPILGWGVSTNHKSSNRIELSLLGKDLLNFWSFDLTRPIDLPIHPHPYPWVEVFLQIINLQTKLNYLDWVKIFKNLVTSSDSTQCKLKPPKNYVASLLISIISNDNSVGVPHARVSATNNHTKSVVFLSLHHPCSHTLNSTFIPTTRELNHIVWFDSVTSGEIGQDKTSFTRPVNVTIFERHLLAFWQTFWQTKWVCNPFGPSKCPLPLAQS